MERYSCVYLTREGERICQLRDNETESIVDIAVSFGMNIVRYAIRDEDIILQPPSLSALRQFPFRFGIPLLCPPGRTSNGTFSHRGKRYELPLNYGTHNMHGLAGTNSWQVHRMEADPEVGAAVHASYVNGEKPERQSCYPQNLHMTLTCRLQEGRLSIEGTVSHAGVIPAPVALGFHPYFKAKRAATMLQIPNCTQWPIDCEGTISGLPVYTKLAERLSRGMALSELQGHLHFFQIHAEASAEKTYRCTIHDRESGRRVAFHVDPLFSKLAVFIPPWGDAISLEPHSCVPDAFNLPFESALTGVRELSPGETLTYRWGISLEQVSEKGVR